MMPVAIIPLFRDRRPMSKDGITLNANFNHTFYISRFIIGKKADIHIILIIIIIQIDERKQKA